MKLFTSYTYTWWQIGIFKVAMLTIGALVGAYYSEWVIENVAFVAMVAVITSMYTALVSLRQKK